MKGHLIVALAVASCVLGGGAVPVSHAAQPGARSSGARLVKINGIISDYLSAMIDHPSTARSARVAKRTNAKLERAIRGAPRRCRTTVRATERQISNLRLRPKAKRKRILDASLPVWVYC